MLRRDQPAAACLPLPACPQAQARSLSQAISALGSAVKADVEQVGALREAVLYLVRSTDTALHTFKRAHAWREASKVRMAVCLVPLGWLWLRHAAGSAGQLGCM